MNPLPGRCPVCSNPLSVTHLHCENCGTGIEGHFGLGRLQALSMEQVQFVEIFMKCKGKIKDVEGELGISYPTVVSRLNDVVRAMGYEVSDSEVSDVDQFEYYQAQALNPQSGPRSPMSPTSPVRPISPVAPLSPPAPPSPLASRNKNERRQQILDELSAGKITAAEALERLNQR